MDAASVGANLRDYLNRLGLDKPAQDEAISGAKKRLPFIR